MKKSSIHNLGFNNLAYPFGQQMNAFQRDSVHNFETGDCRGNISQWSMGYLSVGVDSTFCGDYGFDHRYYLLCKGNIVLAHQQMSEVLFSESTSYVLTESIYDYRKKPYQYYVRMDTLQNTDFESLKGGFQKLSLDKIPEGSQTDYRGAWGRFSE